MSNTYSLKTKERMHKEDRTEGGVASSSSCVVKRSHKDTFNLVMNSRATSDKDLPDRHLLTHFNERLSLRINLNCDNLEH